MRQALWYRVQLAVHRVLTAWENAVLWLIEGVTWNNRWIPVNLRDSLNDQWWEIVDRQNLRFRRIEDIDPRFGGEQLGFWNESIAGTISLDEEDDLLRRAIDFHQQNVRLYYDLAWSEEEEIERLFERLGEVQVDRSRLKQGMKPLYLPPNAALAEAAMLGQPVVALTSEPRWDEDDDDYPNDPYWWAD